jgi:hypothetical protein
MIFPEYSFDGEILNTTQIIQEKYIKKLTHTNSHIFLTVYKGRNILNIKKWKIKHHHQQPFYVRK